MYEFLQFMKQYIQDKFAEDSDIASSYQIKSYDVYTAGHTATQTETQFQILDNSEVERYSTFENENVSYIPLQINLIGFQMKLNGVVTTSREVSIKLAQKIKNWLNELRASNINSNIVRVRIMGMSPALKFEDGTKAHTTAIRCEFWIKYPYVVGETTN